VEVYKESRKSLKVDIFFKRPLTVGRLVYNGAGISDFDARCATFAVASVTAARFAWFQAHLTRPHAVVGLHIVGTKMYDNQVPALE
jgi:hypothetical protein